MAIFDTLFAENGIRNNIPTSEQQTGVLSVETGWTQEYAKNPLMGGRFVKLGDMNAIIHDTQKGVNDLESRVNNLLGVSVVSALSTVIGVGEIGKQFYCTANENMYLLIDNSQLLDSSTLQDAIDLNAVKNITPQKFGLFWVNFSNTKTLPALNTTKTYKNNTDYNIILNVAINSTTLASTNAFTIKVNSVVVAELGAVGNADKSNATIIIPPQAGLEISCSSLGGVVSVYVWAELLDDLSSQGLELVV